MSPRCRAAVWAVAALCAPFGIGGAQARDVSITGAKMDRFGRIELRFDGLTRVQVKGANGVLVIAFAEPASIRAENLVRDLPGYVSAVRRDPDGTGLRLALSGTVKPNVIEAGERVFIDLLPSNWTGLPPGLPPAVIAELAERARVAEAKLAGGERERPEVPKLVRLRLAQLPSLTRFVLDHPPGLKPLVKEGPQGVEIRFEGPFALDEGGEKPKSALGVAAFEAIRDAGGLTIKVKAAPGSEPHAFAEADTIVVDLARPTAAPTPPPAMAAVPPTAPAVGPPPASAAPAEMRRAAPPTAQTPAPVQASAPPPPDAAPSVSPGARSSRIAEPPDPAQRAAGPEDRGPVVASAVTGPDGRSILFPFRARVAAAAYERAGLVTLVFDTGAPIDLSALPQDLRPVSVDAADGLAILRFARSGEGGMRLAAEREGWRLSVEGMSQLPPDAVKVSRTLDDNGHGLVMVGLSNAAQAHWLKEPDGQRIAVVTAFGRTQAVPVPKRFVEFTLPPALHGIVVEARADDLVVGLGRGGVTITREVGLSLSPAGRIGPGGGETQQGLGLVLARDAWVADSAGGFIARYQGLIAEAANAPQSGRAESRYRLARFLIANGLDDEASGILGLARSEDPVFARRRETLLLSGIAAARAGRPAPARTFLNADLVAADPEAVLWRAVVDARERRWSQAASAFRKSLDVVELYPDELAGPIRLFMLGAALETRDLPRAEGELTAIDRLAAGSIPRDDHDLARARVDEAAGRTAPALKGYQKLAEEAGIVVASEAMRRWVSLAFRTGVIDRDAAIDRLETLSVSWRGGETEIGTISELVRLYGDAGRWREMFEMTRRANRYFPDHDLTRSLHDESARMLEALMLGGEGKSLSAVQTLSLFFDFKDLAPVGRRGDEIVRRLADRLVELDLLDQAADLLQHQVDNRLTGVARASVAARLAAIRLLNAKPLQALTALQNTRFSDLPDDVRRFRFLLEARAQSDLSRPNLALEIIEGETGSDFDRMRVAILWTARRWREAGEASEALVGTRWSGAEPLSDRDRGDIVRAGVAYVMADERLAIGRLRQKFSGKMIDSPQARTFDVLTQPGAGQSREFRAIMQDASRPDGLKRLLTDWRESHPDGSATAPSKGAEGATDHAAPAAGEEAQAKPAAIGQGARG